LTLTDDTHGSLACPLPASFDGHDIVRIEATLAKPSAALTSEAV
jgi:hypothetical protein